MKKTLTPGTVLIRNLMECKKLVEQMVMVVNVIPWFVHNRTDNTGDQRNCL